MFKMLSMPMSYITDKLVSTSSTTFVILLIIVILLVHLVYNLIVYPASRWQHHRQVNLPPLAAPSWPLVGCLLSLTDERGTPPYEILARLSLKHGSVFRFNFGSFPTIIISDAAITHEAFAKSSLCADRPPYPMFFNYGQGIIANTNNEILKTHRRFYLTAMRTLMGKGKSHLHRLLVKEIEDLIVRIDVRRKEPFDPFDDLAQTSANVLCSVLFGKHYTLNDAIFKNMLEYLKECYELAGHENERNFIPLLSYLPATKKARRAMEVCDRLRALCRAFIMDATEKYVPNSPRSYVDMYLDFFKKNAEQNDDITNGNVVQDYDLDATLEVNIGDLMAAGTETSSSVASWGLLLLAMHPDVQTKLQREIRRVVGVHRKPEFQDRSHLPYVQAVILEIKRVGSVTPLGVPHSVSSDMKLAGYDIPSGTAVMTNIWWIHNNPEVWSEPHLFKPERFLDEDNALIRREEMMPFSVGRRRCIGEDLATMELFLLFTHLPQRFNFNLPLGGETPSMSAVKQGVTRIPCPYTICATPTADYPS